MHYHYYRVTIRETVEHELTVRSITPLEDIDGNTDWVVEASDDNIGFRQVIRDVEVEPIPADATPLTVDMLV